MSDHHTPPGLLCISAEHGRHHVWERPIAPCEAALRSAPKLKVNVHAERRTAARAGMLSAGAPRPMWAVLDKMRAELPASLAKAPPAPLIIAFVAGEFGVKAEAIIGARRMPEFVKPRHVAIYLMHTMTALSTTRIGRYFGHDHTSVLFAIKKIEAFMPANAEFAEKIEALRRKIEDAFAPFRVGIVEERLSEMVERIAKAIEGLNIILDDGASQKIASAVIAVVRDIWESTRDAGLTSNDVIDAWDAKLKASTTGEGRHTPHGSL